VAVLGAVAGCAAAPRVAYEPAGAVDGATFFVEARADHERHYLVMCRPDRTPPCARVAPITAGSERALRTWAASAAASEEAPTERASTTPLRAPRWRADVSSPATPEETPANPDSNAGTVRIVTPGAWANIYTESGRYLGQTPLQISLPAGRHQLFFRPFGQPVDAPPSITVDVTANESTAVVIRDFAEDPTVQPEGASR
jgi:hypothetical protein